MAFKVAAAGKPLQTAPPYVGTRVGVRGGNGKYRRWRASGRCAHLDHRFPLK